MCDLGQKNATFNLLHCLVTFQRSPEVTDPRIPPLIKSDQICMLSFFEVLISVMGFIFT